MQALRQLAFNINSLRIPCRKNRVLSLSTLTPYSHQCGALSQSMDLSAEEQSRPSPEEAHLNTPSDGINPDDTQPNGGHVAKDEHQFQRAISAWKGINLSALVQDLDKTASDVVENQRDSLVQRKELAQKTKDFRKLEDSAKLGEYKGLLKGGHALALDERR